MPDKNRFTLIKLRNFKGGLHLSRGRTNTYSESAKMLHSDTLKSAIFACAIQLFGEKAISRDSFLDRFRITSAFPYGIDLEKKIQFFFPKPQGRLPIEISGEKQTEKKKLKRLQYLEKKLFEKIIQAEKVILRPENIYKQWASFGRLQDPVSGEKLEIFTSEAFQHVAIARDHGTDSTPYYVDKMYFSEQSGLFFLLSCNEAPVREKIFAALRLLADSGIGTDRNNGMGRFQFDSERDIQDDFDLAVPSNADYQMNLSLFLPSDIKELRQLNNAKYEIVKRGGYIASPANNKHLTIRKKSIYMFTEGSLFRTPEKPKGRVADLKPDTEALEAADIPPVSHSIYRDGKAIFIPCSVHPGYIK